MNDIWYCCDGVNRASDNGWYMSDEVLHYYLEKQSRPVCNQRQMPQRLVTEPTSTSCMDCLYRWLVPEGRS